mmetsp:Transcript_103390/g.328797  ORF Transcript_103390/g.328797 Transcript_103390/m.328797 type:complete len:87 (+) Transcript_103390:71-331(+)
MSLLCAGVDWPSGVHRSPNAACPGVLCLGSEAGLFCCPSGRLGLEPPAPARAHGSASSLSDTTEDALHRVQLHAPLPTSKYTPCVA